jgi:hypothetical protein
VALPDRLPPQIVDPSEKYRKDLAGRMARLRGVQSLRAQLYGIEALDARSRKGEE